MQHFSLACIPNATRVCNYLVTYNKAVLANKTTSLLLTEVYSLSLFTYLVYLLSDFNP